MGWIGTASKAYSVSFQVLGSLKSFSRQSHISGIGKTHQELYSWVLGDA